MLGVSNGMNVKIKAIRKIYLNRSLGYKGPEEITGSVIETDEISKVNNEHGYRLESAFQCLTELNCFSIYRDESGNWSNQTYEQAVERNEVYKFHGKKAKNRLINFARKGNWKQ